MIEINKYKLCPGVEVSAYWGSITGDITDQSDLVEYINEHGGGSDAVWGSITGDIADQSDLTGYVSTALSGYATEDWVTAQSYLVESDLSQYATRQWVTGRGYITSSDLSGYATEDYVTTALSGYATETWVGEQGYITSSALSGYATEDWVTAQSYLTSSSLKTVNNQSLVGSGNIEIGGLTPEQEEAIAPLEETSEGMLYTMELEQNKNVLIYDGFITTLMWNSLIYNIDGDVYLHEWDNIYKWNPDTFSFENLVRFYPNYPGDAPIWKDNSGRFYGALDYELDFDNGTMTSVSLNCQDYISSGNRHVIWKGQYGIYNLRGGQKFDEDTQQFVNWTFNVEPGYSLYGMGENLGLRGVEYDGHYVYYGNNSAENTMFELIEYQDHIDIVAVNEPYFPNMATYEGSPVELYAGHYFNVSGDLFYLCGNYSFKLEDGDWVSFEITQPGSLYTYSSINEIGRGVICGDYLIGFNIHTYNNYYDIMTLTESVKKTGWSPVKRNAVDLISDQYIIGMKRFDYITSKYISGLNQIQMENNNIFYLHKNVTEANEIKFNVSGEFSFNGLPIATKADCIVNKTIIPYGNKVVDVLNTSGYPDPYRDNCWTTHTGRLFYSNSLEFDGTQWNNITPINNVYTQYVYKTTNNTFSSSSDTYLWDDTNSQFTLIASNAPGYGQWDMWPCGDTLRYRDSYKLVNNGGTWSWEQDSLSEYHYGMTYVVNGHVYVLSLENDSVYEYVESTKTYTLLGHYHSWSQYSFAACGEIFNLWNGDTWYRIDFTKVGGTDYYIDTATNIPVAQDYSYWIGEYNDYVYYYRDYINFCYCYDIQYDLPAVPSTNGTYTLQATRTGDTVTYEWVSNVI